MAATVFQRAKVQLVLQEPFYATILLNLNLVECKSGNLPSGRPLWIAATNGTDLFINPKTFEQLSIDEAKGVLKHEVMHIAFMHPWRRGDRSPRRWNNACDYAINPIILEEAGALPTGVLDGTAFKGKTAEQIYALLPDEPEDGGMIDDDLLAPVDNTQAGKQKAQSMIAQAAQAARARGKLPSFVEHEINELLKPKMDWKEQLLEWLTEASPSDYSFRRPNRMYMTGPKAMYLPGMDGNDDMRKLGFMLDTSGSFTMAELEAGLSEVCGAVAQVNPKGLVVAYCDAAVQHSDVFENPNEAVVAQSFKRHGDGGTNMPAGLKWFARNHPDVQAVVVWTDGFTPWGNEADYPFPVLWCITSEEVAPWGATIHVEAETT